MLSTHRHKHTRALPRAYLRDVKAVLLSQLTKYRHLCGERIHRDFQLAGLFGKARQSGYSLAFQARVRALQSQQVRFSERPADNDDTDDTALCATAYQEGKAWTLSPPSSAPGQSSKLKGSKA